MKTLVINMFAGPGAGKTTCAWIVASTLKKMGFVTEYVSEYAKELVWDKDFEKLDGSLAHQKELLAEQTHRIDRLNGQVDFIVTDSPILLNAMYLKEGTEQERSQYTDQVFEQFSSYSNFCVFIQRGTDFEQEGRIHSLAQSQEIDRQVLDMMQHYGIYFGTYTHKTVGVIAKNCVKTYHRINQLPQQQATTQQATESPSPGSTAAKPAPSPEEIAGQIYDLTADYAPERVWGKDRNQQIDLAAQYIRRGKTGEISSLLTEIRDYGGSEEMVRKAGGLLEKLEQCAPKKERGQEVEL